MAYIYLFYQLGLMLFFNAVIAVFYAFFFLFYLVHEKN